MECRNPGQLNSFARPRTCCHDNQGLPPGLLGQFLFSWRTLPVPGKTRPPLSQVSSLPDSDVWAPQRERFPEDPPDPPRLRWQGPEQGEGVPLRTAPLRRLGPVPPLSSGSALFFSTSCSQSWRYPSLLSPPLLCGRCLRIKNHSLDRADCASPEDSPSLLTCLVSSVTVLKTNIFAYFAHFTNRECWLLITIFFWCESGCL